MSPFPVVLCALALLLLAAPKSSDRIAEQTPPATGRRA